MFNFMGLQAAKNPAFTPGAIPSTDSPLPPNAVEVPIIALEEFAPLPYSNKEVVEREDPSRFGGTPVALPAVKSGVPLIGSSSDGKYYFVYIYGVIGASTAEQIAAYADVIRILDTADESITVHFVIHSPGGCVFTAAKLCSAMARTKAVTVAEAAGTVASAATVIFGQASKHIIRDSAVFMYHFSSHGDTGSTLAIALTADVTREYVKKVLIDPQVAKGFLTESDVTEIMKRTDVYISGIAMRERLSKSSSTGDS